MKRKINDFERALKSVEGSYHRRLARQEKVWAGFESEKRVLEDIISKQFREVLNAVGLLDGINPDSQFKAKVLTYEVDYSAKLGVLEVHLHDWVIEDTKSHRGIVQGRNSCPHTYLSLVAGPMTGKQKHSLVLEFMSNYRIFEILFPDNSCPILIKLFPNFFP